MQNFKKSQPNWKVSHNSLDLDPSEKCQQILDSLISSLDVSKNKQVVIGILQTFKFFAPILKDLFPEEDEKDSQMFLLKKIERLSKELQRTSRMMLKQKGNHLNSNTSLTK